MFTDIKDSIVDGISNWLDNRKINLGKPSMPCQNNGDCNNIEKCENNCTCIGGNCFKNVQTNST